MTTSKKAAAAKKASPAKADNKPDEKNPVETPVAEEVSSDASPQGQPAADKDLKKPEMQPALAVSSVSPKGYRRAGRRFTPEPTFLTPGDIDQETMELLMLDKGLHVEPAEVPVKDEATE